MTETERYKELGALTKEKDRWEESIPFWNRSDSNGPARTVSDLLQELSALREQNKGVSRDAVRM